MKIDLNKVTISFDFTPSEYFLVYNKEEDQYSLNYRIDRSDKGKDDDVGMERLIVYEDEAIALKKYFTLIEM